MRDPWALIQKYTVINVQSLEASNCVAITTTTRCTPPNNCRRCKSRDHDSKITFVRKFESPFACVVDLGVGDKESGVFLGEIDSRFQRNLSSRLVEQQAEIVNCLVSPNLSVS